MRLLFRVAREFAEGNRRSVAILSSLALIALASLSPTHAAHTTRRPAHEGPQETDFLGRLLAVEMQCNDPCPQAEATTNIRSEIERVADDARLFLERLDTAAGHEGAEARIAALNHFIFGQLGIKPSRDLTDPDNLLLGQVLMRKRGYCVGIASLYLVLADRLGLPVRAVATPSHLFLRYDDGVTRINIETFQEGAQIPDEQYVRDEKIPPESIRRGIFLSNLSDEEFLAQVCNNIGVIESGKKNYALAASRYEQALVLYPRFPAALYNYGTDLLHGGRAVESVRFFSRSLRLYPADAWALNNRGLAYMKMGRREKARRDFVEALQISPSFDQARKNLEQAGTPSE